MIIGLVSQINWFFFFFLFKHELLHLFIKSIKMLYFVYWYTGNTDKKISEQIWYFFSPFLIKNTAKKKLFEIRLKKCIIYYTNSRNLCLALIRLTQNKISIKCFNCVGVNIESIILIIFVEHINVIIIFVEFCILFNWFCKLPRTFDVKWHLT